MTSLVDGAAAVVESESVGEDTSPMVGPLVSPLVLLPEYEAATSPGFLPGIRYIGKHYTTMRRIRRDGNCFYRAFLFAYLDSLLQDCSSGDATKKSLAEAERLRILHLISGSKDELVAIGYSEMAIESFYDVLVELITDLFTNTTETLLANFQVKSHCHTRYNAIL